LVIAEERCDYRAINVAAGSRLSKGGLVKIYFRYLPQESTTLASEMDAGVFFRPRF
jgi:hypothetical protein